jgi:hypothetical protein
MLARHLTLKYPPITTASADMIQWQASASMTVRIDILFLLYKTSKI